MAALRKRVVGDVKRKLDDSEILNRPHLEQSSPPERPAAAARHRRARGHRPRGWRSMDRLGCSHHQWLGHIVHGAGHGV